MYSPSAARRRPSRAVDSIRAGRSVRRARRLAMRTETSASSASTTAAGTPITTDSSRVTVEVYCAAAITAGSASTDNAPSTTESVATPLRGSGAGSALLLLVGATTGCGRDRAADHACDCDQRQDVRERLDQDVDSRQRLVVGLHPVG